MSGTWDIRVGDALTQLREMPDESVQCCVTSPPYFGLRDYKTAPVVWGGNPNCKHAWGDTLPPRPGRGNAPGDLSTSSLTNPKRQDEVPRATDSGAFCQRCNAWRGHLGLEPTPDLFVEHLVGVFQEVRRVLRSDGTLWLNIGDSYNAAGRVGHGTRIGYKQGTNRASASGADVSRANAPDLKEKDLLGIPWMLAFALRADGWYLRSDIILSKRNPMPESVSDRPTSAHEHMFLLSKSPRYYWDADAIREEGKDWSSGGPGTGILETQHYGAGNGGNAGLAGIAQRYKDGSQASGRNKRNVWEVTTEPYAGAHFAVFGTKWIEPCIFAGSSPKACGECGAPWQRVTASETRLEGNSARAGRSAEEIAAGGKWTPEHLNGNANLKAGPVVNVQTLGWRSGCVHQDDTGRSVVLDPFAGSGTVGVVCGWHGRDFIGLELNPEYAEMARRRIISEGRPSRPKSERPKVSDDQIAMEF